MRRDINRTSLIHTLKEVLLLYFEITVYLYFLIDRLKKLWII